MIYNDKVHLSRDAKEYKNNYLKNVGKVVTEDIALVLSAISKLTLLESRFDRDSKDPTGVTPEEIAKATRLNISTIKPILWVLLVPLFIRRVKINRFWRYSITQLGEEALPYMVDEDLFLGRKQKIAIILAKTIGNSNNNNSNSKESANKC